MQRECGGDRKEQQEKQAWEPCAEAQGVCAGKNDCMVTAAEMKLIPQQYYIKRVKNYGCNKYMFVSASYRLSQ